MATTEPIELAGIPEGGISKSGERVWFRLETLAGDKHSFSCPHEAVSEIIQKLFLWADTAWKARGSPEELDVEGKPLKAKAFTSTGYVVGYAKTGVVVSILCGPLKYEMVLPPDICSQLSEALAQGRLEWDIRQRPN